jgi:hypothetical protein
LIQATNAGRFFRLGQWSYESPFPWASKLLFALFKSIANRYSYYGYATLAEWWV